MIINPSITPKIVERFDFILAGGVPFSITIDKEAGDVVDWDKEHLPSVIFHKAAQASTADPDQKYPPEITTIFLNQILVVTRTQFEVMPATPDQIDMFRKSLHRLSPAIN